MTGGMTARPELTARLLQAMENSKLVYLSAGSGWGKTTALAALAREGAALLRAREPDCLARLEHTLSDRVLLDNLQALSDPEDQAALVSILAEAPPQRRFVLAGRAALPQYLKPFWVTGQLTLLGEADLALTPEQTARAFRQAGLTPDPVALVRVQEAFGGYPTAVSLLLARMGMGEAFGEALLSAVRQDVYDCLDMGLFRLWGRRERQLLLCLASFPRFSLGLAEAASDLDDAQALLARVLAGCSLLRAEAGGTCAWRPGAQDYLLHKQRQLCSREDIRWVHRRAGAYLEAAGDLIGALEHNQLAREMDKVGELLIRNAERHPGNGHFYDTERFYHALPERVILDAPELMCCMCMIAALNCQLEQSEDWYRRLADFARRVDRRDPRWPIARSKLAYLRIALPQRGVRGVVPIIKDVSGMMLRGEIQLQDFSVTSNLPSIMNGGKDFSSWSRWDRLLYRTLRGPVERLLGPTCRGLPHIALGESLFEKALPPDYVDVLGHLSAGLAEASNQGALEMQFAATALMARLFAAQGSMDTAQDLIVNLMDQARRAGAREMLANMEAFRVRQQLLQGDPVGPVVWRDERAPDELARFRGMLRYAYLTKARVYLQQGQHLQALALLERLLGFARLFERPYMQLETQLLTAVALFRMGRGDWEAPLAEALAIAEKYRFIRPVADEGAAVLPLLRRARPIRNQEFRADLMAETQRQAAYYPQYLATAQPLIEPLTEAEGKVLRLLVQGLRNEQIAQTLGVSLNTVKYHIKNLYGKLGAANRSAAVKIALDQKLI